MAQQYYDVEAMRQYLAANAPKYGIDPATALKVWGNEGLKEGVWQSNIYKNGKREPSYGPFQFYMGGGMGNDFLKETGLDPRDPKNVYAMADYAMQKAGQNGWGAWYGARDNGVGPWEGITRGVKGPGPSGYDDPSISAQNYGFGAPNLPSLGKLALDKLYPESLSGQSGVAMNSMPQQKPVIVPAVGAPPSEAPAPTGIMGALANLFQTPQNGLLNTLRNKSFGVVDPSAAYKAQQLEEQGWPSLRSYYS